MQKARRRALARLLKYGSVDILLLPLNIGLATALDAAGVPSSVATSAGFFAQMTIAFFLNRRWTFHVSVSTREGVAKTWLIGLSDLILAVLATELIQGHYRFSYFWARLVASVFVGVWDYMANSLFTFKTAFWK